MKSFTEELEEQGKLEFDQVEAKTIVTRLDLIKQPSQEVTEEEPALNESSGFKKWFLNLIK
jgi:hypothetical protein